MRNTGARSSSGIERVTDGFRRCFLTSGIASRGPLDEAQSATTYVPPRL